MWDSGESNLGPASVQRGALSWLSLLPILSTSSASQMDLFSCLWHCLGSKLENCFQMSINYLLPLITTAIHGHRGTTVELAD